MSIVVKDMPDTENFEFRRTVMYERMLNKQVVPTIEEMTAYCGENAERFSMINEWLTRGISNLRSRKKLNLRRCFCGLI